MSFAVKTISKSDGRLSSKRSLFEGGRSTASTVIQSTARVVRLGVLASTLKTARIRKKNQLISNANDAISLIQVADGALNSTTVALCEMRSLEGPSDPAPAPAPRATPDPVAALPERVELTEKIWKIFIDTRFNNQTLLDGAVCNQVYVVGDSPDQTISVTIDGLDAIVAVLREKEEARAHAVDDAIRSVSGVRTRLGLLHSRFEAAVAMLQRATINTTGAVRSRVLDGEAEAVEETVNFMRDVIMRQKERSVVTQANQQPHVAMQLLET